LSITNCVIYTTSWRGLESIVRSWKKGR